MLRRIVRPLFDGLLDLVFPNACLLCHFPFIPSEPKAHLCPECLKKIQYSKPLFCRKCPRQLKSPEQIFCGRCRPEHLFFDRCWSATLYNDTLRYLMHLFKYGKNTGLRIHFSEFIINFVQKNPLPVHECDIIIPVPLHSTRFRERGFNQSELIAMLLAEHFQIPCDPHAVKRWRYTVNQARVNSKQRWTNIKSTFTIKHPANLSNTNILIIDDLITTGATLSEIAFLLKAAGANKVYALTVAVAV